MALLITRQSFIHLRLIQKLRIPLIYKKFYTTIDALDVFTSEILQKHKQNKSCENLLSSRYYMENDSGNENATQTVDLETKLLNLLSKNKDKQIENTIKDCVEKRTFINSLTLKKLLRFYSGNGRPDMVIILQKYCYKIEPSLYIRNGEFLHYLAKAQCMKGNSEKGLEILQHAYQKYKGLRSLYRSTFKELINDSVLNRSEASLVVFKKYVLDFSITWSENYPLLCLWHLCWSSSWFSDQMLANELIDTSSALRDVVGDKAAAFSVSILRDNYNEDAVIQLLQIFLKYKMMTEYSKVLQILFIYKIKKRDSRGCAEIIKNCETLGISFPSYIHGKYIKMLITGNVLEKPTSKPDSKTFKLKF